MIRTNKYNETKPDFEEMMSEVKEDIQEQDAEQDIINRVPELKELSGCLLYTSPSPRDRG